MQTIYLASDHAAYEEKSEIIEYLRDRFKTIDLGTNGPDSVSYSSFGLKLGASVAKDSKSLGIAICGSGIGISIAVNRFKGVRGALCRDVQDAKICKEHNNANVICFGARRNTLTEMKQMIEAWLESEFEGGRHQKRIETLDE